MFVKIVLDTPYAGTEEVEYMEFPNETAVRLAFQEMVEQHADEYDYLVLGWGVSPKTEEDEIELEEFHEECYNNSYWEEISEEEYYENY